MFWGLWSYILWSFFWRRAFFRIVTLANSLFVFFNVFFIIYVNSRYLKLIFLLTFFVLIILWQIFFLESLVCTFTWIIFLHLRATKVSVMSAASLRDIFLVIMLWSILFYFIQSLIFSIFIFVSYVLLFRSSLYDIFIIMLQITYKILSLINITIFDFIFIVYINFKIFLNR